MMSVYIANKETSISWKGLNVDGLYLLPFCLQIEMKKFDKKRIKLTARYVNSISYKPLKLLLVLHCMILGFLASVASKTSQSN